MAAGAHQLADVVAAPCLPRLGAQRALHGLQQGALAAAVRAADHIDVRAAQAQALCDTIDAVQWSEMLLEHAALSQGQRLSPSVHDVCWCTPHGKHPNSSHVVVHSVPV